MALKNERQLYEFANTKVPNTKAPNAEAGNGHLGLSPTKACYSSTAPLIPDVTSLA